MNTFILDLDGTMMPSHDVDNECYWHAVRDVFGVPSRTPELTRYDNVTDTGILSQWAREQFGREATTDEINRVKTLFLYYLRSEAERHQAEFLPTLGLQDWLTRTLSNHAGRVAIATGGWRHTAQFKLRISGLARFGLPLASSDDATLRTGIMVAALSRLAGRQPGQRSVTYIGDGPWDVHAARMLGWRFIGIASGRRAAALRACGAQRIYGDFARLMGDDGHGSMP